jgi:hypothetical protein
LHSTIAVMVAAFVAPNHFDLLIAPMMRQALLIN